MCTVGETARRDLNSASHAVPFDVLQQRPSAGRRRVLHLRRALSSPPTNGFSTILLTRLILASLLLILAHSIPNQSLVGLITKDDKNDAERHRSLTDDLDAQLLSSPSSLNLLIIWNLTSEW